MNKFLVFGVLTLVNIIRIKILTHKLSSARRRALKNLVNAVSQGDPIAVHTLDRMMDNYLNLVRGGIERRMAAYAVVDHWLLKSIWS